MVIPARQCQWSSQRHENVYRSERLETSYISMGL